jgi:hypothetical protein
LLAIPRDICAPVYCACCGPCALRAVASVGLVVAFSIVEFVAKKALDYMEIE